MLNGTLILFQNTFILIRYVIKSCSCYHHLKITWMMFTEQVFTLEEMFSMQIFFLLNGLLTIWAQCTYSISCKTLWSSYFMVSTFPCSMQELYYTDKFMPIHACEWGRLQATLPCLWMMKGYIANVCVCASVVCVVRMCSSAWKVLWGDCIRAGSAGIQNDCC